MKAKTLLLPRFVVTYLVLLIWAGTASGATEKVLYNFSAYPHGSEPAANLIADSSGNLYGTTVRGGAHEAGMVFKLTPNSKGGWTQAVLYSFKGVTDGVSPYAGLIFDSAGNLYGTTYLGGTSTCNGGNTGCGTVFKLAPNSHGGWTESVIYTFQGGSDGAWPYAGLIFDSAGNLYGTTSSGGAGSQNCFEGACGTVFKLSPNSHGGWTESVLYSFTGGSDGAYPHAELIFDAAGNLYGTTPLLGGTSTVCRQRQGCGTVFKLTPSSGTWTLSVLYSFAGGTDGNGPSADLIFDKAGNLYGTTIAGGPGLCAPEGCGTVFELMMSNGNGSFTESILHSFSGGTGDGATPETGLVFDQAGNLYGATQTGGKTKGGNGVIFQLAPGSGGQWSESILHVFAGGADGANPSSGAALIFDQANNLYGTTSSGGPGGSLGTGTAFQLTPTAGGHWTKSTLYSFPSSDGQDPDGSLVMDTTGNFYGTTLGGGTYGRGEVFKLAPNSAGGWAKSTVYSFKGTIDGYGPSDLVFDTAGNLYGVAQSNAGGAVFELKPNTSGTWTESTLYAFTGSSDGTNPVGLIFDAGGNLYGATSSGGAYAGGTVYELTPNGSGGWTKSVLYSFNIAANSGGSSPLAGLVFDGAGNLYGTTSLGGTSCCNGVVFELSPSSGGGWTESVLYNFTGGSDGANPSASLIFDPAGNLYGTTYAGGITSTSCGGEGYCGTVFMLTHSSGGWTESVLHRFTGGSDGAAGSGSMPALVIDAAGNLYGTTPYGGDITCNYGQGCGIVYMLAPGTGSQWTESVLYSFTGYPSDGGGGASTNPLIIDAGILYGASPGGGIAGDGAVFAVTP